LVVTAAVGLAERIQARRGCRCSSATLAQPPRWCPGAVRIPTAGIANALRPWIVAPPCTGLMTGASTGRWGLMEVSQRLWDNYGAAGALKLLA